MTDHRSAGSPESPVPVDGHAHLHGSAGLGRSFDAALGNFRRVAPLADPAGVLLLMEPADSTALIALRDGSAEMAAGWHLEGLEDGISLAASRPTGETIILVRGRQVCTAENLEILLAGAPHVDMEGMPFESALAAAMEIESALAIAPWGFGKWWGTRGRLVRDAIERYGARLCLGDNGGRPKLTPEPRLFATARKRDIMIVPGSDPLPLPFELRRIGSYGFWCHDPVRSTHPFESITRYLRSGTARLDSYGRRRSWAGFARSQAALRMSGLRLDRPSRSDRETHTGEAAG